MFFPDLWAGLCPGADDELLQEMQGSSGPQDLLKVYTKLREENQRLNELHKADATRVRELVNRLESLEAENDSLAATVAARAETASTPHESAPETTQHSKNAIAADSQSDREAEDALRVQVAKLQEEASALQARLDSSQAEVERLTTQNTEESRAREQRVQELEAECTRLQTCIASREAVAITAEKQRQSHFQEKERALEARVRAVEQQMRMSLEMQEQLIEERKILEEDKRGLEGEVLRQQEAAEELQAVLSNFFPDDDSSTLQNELRDVGLGPEHSAYSPELDGSKHFSATTGHEYHQSHTEQSMQDLHVRLNSIALKWTGDEART